MEYDPTGNSFDEIHRSSPAVREMLQEAAEIGAAFWTQRSRVRTGFNSRSVEARVVMEDGYPEGEVYAFGYYARFREHGTRYNRPERVLQQAISVIEAGG